jgi:hypothetical protein
MSAMRADLGRLRYASLTFCTSNQGHAEVAPFNRAKDNRVSGLFQIHASSGAQCARLTASTGAQPAAIATGYAAPTP